MFPPPPDAAYRFVRLLWRGPFRFDGARLVPHLPASDRDLEELRGPAVYAILGWSAVYGPRTLLYIGRTDSETPITRLRQHAKWLKDEWEVEVLAASVDSSLLCDVEHLLVWAHKPCYNANLIATCHIDDLRIWNTGLCPRLLPDVSAAHPWFCPTGAMGADPTTS